jgi:hypothetical protein
MKQTSHSILGRLAKATAVGCLLALVFLATTSVQSKTSAKARPFKATAIYTQNEDYTFQATGNATHLGNYVGQGFFWVEGGALQVRATWTAANGDTLELEFPDWLFNYESDFSFGVGNIIGGTGRFANASGSGFATISPIVPTPGIPFILTMEGTISY